jgi:hypothetical protein
MDKRGLEFEEVVRWLIALFILLILVISFLILKGRGSALISKFFEILRFGR